MSQHAKQAVVTYPVPTKLKDINTVLVKLTFSSPKFLPLGIHKVHRDSDRKMDVKHQFDVLKHDQRRDLTTVGRHREGRVDTGTPVINNPPLAHAALLRRGLVNNGFVLADLHYYVRQPDATKSPRFTVVASYSPRKEDASVQITPELIEALRALSNMTWQYCSVWDNPDGSQTINFGGLQMGAKPRTAIRALNGIIQASSVSDFVAEENE